MACVFMCREQEHLLKKEQEQMRSTMPRFETEDEKVERLKREKELAEFGEVSVAFRLSSPNPRCVFISLFSLHDRPYCFGWL